MTYLFECCHFAVPGTGALREEEDTAAQPQQPTALFQAVQLASLVHSVQPHMPCSHMHAADLPFTLCLHSSRCMFGTCVSLMLAQIV